MAAAELSRIETAIGESQLRWIGHVRLMEENQLPKITLYGELEHGKRLSGGQRKRYRDQVYALLKKADLINGWSDLAEDRNQWRHEVQDYQGVVVKNKESIVGTGQQLSAEGKLRPRSA